MGGRPADGAAPARTAAHLRGPDRPGTARDRADHHRLGLLHHRHGDPAVHRRRCRQRAAGHRGDRLHDRGHRARRLRDRLPDHPDRLLLPQPGAPPGAADRAGHLPDGRHPVGDGPRAVVPGGRARHPDDPAHRGPAGVPRPAGRAAHRRPAATDDPRRPRPAARRPGAAGRDRGRPRRPVRAGAGGVRAVRADPRRTRRGRHHGAGHARPRRRVPVRRRLALRPGPPAGDGGPHRRLLRRAHPERARRGPQHHRRGAGGWRRRAGGPAGGPARPAVPPAARHLRRHDDELRAQAVRLAVAARRTRR